MNGKVFSPDEVRFDKQRGGYDRQQVDRYIEMLSKEYKTVCAKYTAVCDKHQKLYDSYNKLKQQSEGLKTNSSVISKTLVDAEVMAHQIIAKAEAEAEKIKADAYIQKVAAERSVELKNEYLTQTIKQLQGLLTEK